MNSGGVTRSSAPVVASPAPGWRIAGTSDPNNDGTTDYVFQNVNTGAVSIWFMTGTQGTTCLTAPVVAVPIDAAWTVRGTQ